MYIFFVSVWEDTVSLVGSRKVTVKVFIMLQRNYSWFSGAMAQMPEIKTKLCKGSEKVTKGLETAKCLSQLKLTALSSNNKCTSCLQTNWTKNEPLLPALLLYHEKCNITGLGVNNFLRECVCFFFFFFFFFFVRWCCKNSIFFGWPWI